MTAPGRNGNGPPAEAESELVIELRDMAARLNELADRLAEEHGLEDIAGG